MESILLNNTNRIINRRHADTITVKKFPKSLSIRDGSLFTGWRATMFWAPFFFWGGCRMVSTTQDAPWCVYLLCLLKGEGHKFLGCHKFLGSNLGDGHNFWAHLFTTLVALVPHPPVNDDRVLSIILPEFMINDSHKEHKAITRDRHCCLSFSFLLKSS